MPPTWQGHPLRKEHPARATEMGPSSLPPERREQRSRKRCSFHPEEWGMQARGEDGTDFMFLNLGPAASRHARRLRIVLQLDGEEIVDAVPDIGFHHRGAEKMGERQTWHTYIPYTDRVDYLGGVMNNLPYVLAVEKLAGIEVPDRAKVIRVMLAELFRIISHLVWYGTFAQDLGALSPVFYMFNDRERALRHRRGHQRRAHAPELVPHRRRGPGPARRAGTGWCATFCDYLPPRLDEYDEHGHAQPHLQGAHARASAATRSDEAIEWGVTGPGLRACGLEWDFRKKRPYSGYEQFEFDIPTAHSAATATTGPRCASRRCARACASSSSAWRTCPPAPTRRDHPLATPPLQGAHDARHRDADHPFPGRELGAGHSARARPS